MQVEEALRSVDRRLLVGGERLDAEGGATFTTENPTTGGPPGESPHGSPVDVRRAVEAARGALDGRGSGLSAAPRGRLLGELACGPAAARCSP